MEWEKLARKALSGIYPALNEMTDDELKQLRDDLPSMATETNCWWLIYQAKNLLSEVADSVLYKRNNLEEKATAPIDTEDAEATG